MPIFKALDFTGTDTSDATATTSNILSGKTAYIASGKATGTMTNRGTVSGSVGVGGTYTIQQGYHSGSGTVSGPSLSGNASTSNVLSGKTFYASSGTKQTGTMTNQGSLNKTLYPGDSTSISSGYYSGGSVSALGSKATLIWKNYSTSSSFPSQTINLYSSVSGSHYLLIYYANARSSSAVRHSIVWAPEGYSSSLDERGYGGDGYSTTFSAYFREFFVSSSTTMWWGPCVETRVDSSISVAQVQNNYCIPFEIYDLGIFPPFIIS